MKTIIPIYIISLFFVSCTGKEDKIEIYLLNKRIQTAEGIPVLEYIKLKKIKYDKNIENVKDLPYDSISKEFIYGGKFAATVKDLQATPLINNDEILKLDLEHSELFLSEQGRNKIKKLVPNMRTGTQFAICVNKKPVLTGYFRSNYSSFIYTWNYIGYSHIKSSTNFEDKNFVIRQNQGSLKWSPILTDLKDNNELVDAFRRTDRLKQDSYSK